MEDDFSTCKNDTPGNIYEDKNKVFEFFNLAKDYSDGKNTGEAAQRFKRRWKNNVYWGKYKWRV